MSYHVLSWALPNGMSVKEMELAIYRSIFFIYPSFASLKCLVCQSSTPDIDIHRQTSFPRNHTPKVSTMYPVIPYKVFSSWNSRNVRIISAKDSGDYSLKKERELKIREENPTLPKSCKQGVQIKDQIPFPSMSPYSYIPLIFHKIGIWLSSNPSWITIWLGNIGNQGMQHSSYP